MVEYVISGKDGIGDINTKEDIEDSVENIKETIGILQRVASKIVGAYKSKKYGDLLKIVTTVALTLLGVYGISLV